jgi:hypothetical protein
MHDEHVLADSCWSLRQTWSMEIRSVRLPCQAARLPGSGTYLLLYNTVFVSSTVYMEFLYLLPFFVEGCVEPTIEGS